MRVLFDDLFTRLESALAAVRRAVGAEEPLLLSAGGSILFDMVIARGLPIVRTDGDTQLLLRSGSCYYGDHGAMPERFAAIMSRNLLGSEAFERVASFRPALRLWAEVLSVHDRVAICGLGLRDAAHDQGLPIPLRLWRDGHPIGALSGHAVLTKFNDQHAFVDASDANLDVGDVVEFGVRHPCTTIDKHDLIYGLGSDGRVRKVFRTFFG
jgi:D-serine dehydratase